MALFKSPYTKRLEQQNTEMAVELITLLAENKLLKIQNQHLLAEIERLRQANSHINTHNPSLR